MKTWKFTLISAVMIRTTFYSNHTHLMVETMEAISSSIVRNSSNFAFLRNPQDTLSIVMAFSHFFFWSFPILKHLNSYFFHWFAFLILEILNFVFIGVLLQNISTCHYVIWKNSTNLFHWCFYNKTLTERRIIVIWCFRIDLWLAYWSKRKS